LHPRHTIDSPLVFGLLTAGCRPSASGRAPGQAPGRHYHRLEEEKVELEMREGGGGNGRWERDKDGVGGGGDKRQVVRKKKRVWWVDEN
jgi:hypothetical protein